MKNIVSTDIVNCIVKSSEDYEMIIKSIYGEEATVEFSSEGIYVGYMNDADNTIDDIYERLAEYFDVAEVTSIHTDANSEFSVWICYKDYTKDSNSSV